MRTRKNGTPRFDDAHHRRFLIVVAIFAILGFSQLAHATAPTGEVILIGTPIDRYNSSGSAAALFANPPNFVAQNGWSSTGYAGIDLGSGNSTQLTSARIASGVGGAEKYNAGTMVLADTGSDMHTITPVEVGMWGYGEVFPGYGWTEKPMNVRSSDFTSGQQSPVGRCFAMENDTSYLKLSAIEFIADPGTFTGTPSCMPIEPAIAPWGGNFSSQSVTVTLDCRTTNALLYYTLDGTTPTTSSTLYSGPFILNIASGGTTLSVLAYQSGCTTTSSNVSVAYFRPYSFAGGSAIEDKYDDRGSLVEAKDAGIWFGDGRYWRVGACSPTTNNGATSLEPWYQDGLWLYSSTDCVNWRRETSAASTSGRILDDDNVHSPQRPHVLYSSLTHKWVLWAHLSGVNLAGIATADNERGPWKWIKQLNPDGNGIQDMNLFADTNGLNYVAYTRGSNGPIAVSQLSADLLSTNGNTIQATSTYYEAPALFKGGSTYFLLASEGNYYDSSGNNYSSGDTDPLTQDIYLNNGPTGGNFTLSVETSGPTTDTTGNISYSATAATLASNIQTAMQALGNVGSGHCSVAVETTPGGATYYRATFSSITVIANLTGNAAGLTGGTSPTITAGESNSEMNVVYYYNTGASPVTGTWVGPFDLFAANPIGTNLNGQPTQELPINGQPTLFLDWWGKYNFHFSRDVVLPLNISGNTLSVSASGAWNLPTASVNPSTGGVTNSSGSFAR